jgi:hypothetical protein
MLSEVFPACWRQKPGRGVLPSTFLAVPAADSAGMRPKHLSDYMQSLVTGVWPGRGDHRVTLKINDHPWHAAPVIHIFCSILPQVAFACPAEAVRCS